MHLQGTAMDQPATGDLQMRLTALVRASGELLESLETGNLPAAIVRVGRSLLRSDAAALWRLHAGVWTVAGQEGLSPASDHETAGDPLSFDEPMQINDVDTADLPGPRRQAFQREGIRALLVVPLSISGGNKGAMVFYERQARCCRARSTSTPRWRRSPRWPCRTSRTGVR